MQNKNIVLKGRRVYLRGLRENDASQEYCRWLNDPAVNKFLVTTSSTMEELKSYIKQRVESGNCLFAGIFLNKNDRHIGTIKLEPIDWQKKEATLGILIGDKDSQGYGFGAESLALLLDYADKELGLKKIKLGTFSGNAPAIACFKKVGFDIDAIEKSSYKRDHQAQDILMMSRKAEASASFYIENLTAHTWIFHILPCLFKTSGRLAKRLHYVDSSGLGLLLARLTAWSVDATLEPLNFSMFDIRDENGDQMWWKVEYEDSIDFQNRHIRNHPELKQILTEHDKKSRLSHFLRRRIVYFDLTGKNLNLLLNILFLIRVIRQKEDDKNKEPINLFLISYARPWLSELRKWARNKNVNIIPSGGIKIDIKRFILQFEGIRSFVKKMAYCAMAVKYRFQNHAGSEKLSRIGEDSKSSSPKMALDYFGHLNLFSPQLNSDFFFAQQSKLERGDILVCFQHPKFPVMDKELSEIKKFGMKTIATNSNILRTPLVPVFSYTGRSAKIVCSKNGRTCADDFAIRRSLYRQVGEYYKQYDYWKAFIKQKNIKIHVSWYNFDYESCALFDALEDAGGVAATYDRSFFNLQDPPWTTFIGGVVFGFSKYGAQIGNDQNSIAPYYVVTGYLGDHRFPLLKEKATEVKNCLRIAGARRILAYLDENSVDDSRWGIGHDVTRENYAYILNKVLKNPQLGLVLKPKNPLTFKRRLGGVAALLDEARKTGRCFVFDEGDWLASYPVAIAALAADVAIHGHFFAATAGVEAALTGTPTVVLDREGFSKSPLYKLGLGTVIFRNWNDLWEAYEEHEKADGMPGFGDWSPFLGEIDSFRDGRAAERMGTYLHWLIEGFKAKMPRETILADAADRYVKIWGKDKVLLAGAPAENRLASVKDDFYGEISRAL